MSAPPPLFVLCPGRSFSSVVATMLGQHPQCYGLPEVNLFLGKTLGEAWDVDVRRGGFPMQGLKRAVAELEYGAQTEETVRKAVDWIAERHDWTSRQAFDWMQGKLGDRILVDKSPANVFRPSVLAHLFKSFPDARFLQLLRHPRSRGISHMKATRALQKRALIKSASTTDLDYEFKWSGTHRMIRALGEELPPSQFMWIRGEDLLKNPRVMLTTITDWLNIDSGPEAIEEMLHPENSPFACLGPTEARNGANPGFLANPVLDTDRLERMEIPDMDSPLEWDPKRSFSPDTVELAKYYGYV